MQWSCVFAFVSLWLLQTDAFPFVVNPLPLLSLVYSTLNSHSHSTVSPSSLSWRPLSASSDDWSHPLPSASPLPTPAVDAAHTDSLAAPNQTVLHGPLDICKYMLQGWINLHPEVARNFLGHDISKENKRARDEFIDQMLEKLLLDQDDLRPAEARKELLSLFTDAP